MPDTARSRRSWALLSIFGTFGLLHILMLTRWVDRFGPGHFTSLTLAAMALPLLNCPAATKVAGLACQMQQQSARLVLERGP